MRRRPPPGAPKQLYAWSYSRLQDWENCPAQAWYKHGMRIRTPPGPAAERGQRIHETAEHYIKGDLPPAIPEFLKIHAKAFKQERALYAKSPEKLLVEKSGGQWAFDEQWRPVDYFAKTTYVRIVIDLGIRHSDTVLEVIDHKSGKPRDSHHDQISLYGLGGFSRFRGLEEVIADIRYIDHKRAPNMRTTYVKKDVPELQAYWRDRAAPMLADRTFEATPSRPTCRYCDHGKSKGGPCTQEVV